MTVQPVKKITCPDCNGNGYTSDHFVCNRCQTFGTILPPDESQEVDAEAILAAENPHELRKGNGVGVELTSDECQRLQDEMLTSCEPPSPRQLWIDVRIPLLFSVGDIVTPVVQDSNHGNARLFQVVKVFAIVEGDRANVKVVAGYFDGRIANDMQRVEFNDFELKRADAKGGTK
jgi:hypothetical protein